jgi:hypothetical protein
LDTITIGAFAVFLAIVILDLYFDVLYHGVGRALLLAVSRGRFPPQQPSPLQRLAASATGAALVVAVLLAVFFAVEFLT